MKEYKVHSCMSQMQALTALMTFQKLSKLAFARMLTTEQALKVLIS